MNPIRLVAGLIAAFLAAAVTREMVGDGQVFGNVVAWLVGGLVFLASLLPVAGFLMGAALGAAGFGFIGFLWPMGGGHGAGLALFWVLVLLAGGIGMLGVTMMVGAIAGKGAAGPFKGADGAGRAAPGARNVLSPEEIGQLLDFARSDGSLEPHERRVLADLVDHAQRQAPTPEALHKLEVLRAKIGTPAGPPREDARQ